MTLVSMFYDEYKGSYKLLKYAFSRSSVTLTFGPRSPNFKILILLMDDYMCTKFGKISYSGSKLIKYLRFGVKSVFFEGLYLSNPFLKLYQKPWLHYIGPNRHRIHFQNVCETSGFLPYFGQSLLCKRVITLLPLWPKQDILAQGERRHVTDTHISAKFL